MCANAQGRLDYVRCRLEKGSGAIDDRIRTLQRTVEGSTRVVGLYDGDRQIGFARAVSDGVTVAYLADVYVLPAYRGRGLGLSLVREIVEGGEADWAEVRWLLHTADAQGLYRKIGFAEGLPTYPLMERGRGYDGRR